MRRLGHDASRVEGKCHDHATASKTHPPSCGKELDLPSGPSSSSL